MYVYVYFTHFFTSLTFTLSDESLFYFFQTLSQMRNWKRRYFLLEENSMSYFKSDLVINIDGDKWSPRGGGAGVD